MTQVTPLGFLRTRLDERLAQLQEDYRSVYGADIQVDPDDIDGEFLAILADRISDLDQLAEDVYDSFNPQTASGVALMRLVQLNGIRILAGEYSTVDLTVGGTQGTVVPAGSLVKSTVNNTVWTTLADVTIDGTGVAIVAARRTDKDSTTAAANTLTKISTPVFGWQTVTNVNPAIPGRLQETEEALRIRRRASTNTPAQCILDAIAGSLANLTGVRLVEVYENYTDSVDSNGQAPHSIYAVVEGGAAADIGQIIWVKKTAGATLVGSTTVVATDILGRPHNVSFDRPIYTDVYITVTVTGLPGFPSDGALQIKNALVAWALGSDTGDGKPGLQIGEDLVQTRLYSPVNTVPFHRINSITLGITASPAGTSDIVIPFNGLARLDISRIVVNVL